MSQIKKFLMTLNYYSNERRLLDQQIAISLNYPDNAFSCLSSDLAEQFLIKASQEIENSFLSEDLLNKEKYSSAVRSLQLSILNSLQDSKISCPKCDRMMKGKEESNLICLGCELYFEKENERWSLYEGKISTNKNWNDTWSVTRAAGRPASAAGAWVRAAVAAACHARAPGAAARHARAARILEAPTLIACLKLYKMKAFI